ncbi:MAG: serine/threonine-protein kinase, partial [Gemmatimonadales bacterium]
MIDVRLDDPIVLALRQATAGDYDILAELGRGGMAIVYLAHDFTLDRKVAIKVMFPSLLSEEGTAERFKREARTAASLTHPGIIPIHAVRHHGSLLFIVMQFVKGRALDSILTEKGPLPIPMVQTILHQVGTALDYAHRQGVVHRDIKPGNILLDEEGRVVVTDFGIAKVVSSDSLTRTGGVVGTPSYMSPEQCTAGTVTGASDQYSLGTVAYEMLTGQLPLHGDNAMQTMYLRVTQDAPSISHLRPDCPPEIESAVLRMLARDPAERWPDLSHALAAIGAPSAARGEEVRHGPTLARRFDRRIPLVVAAVAAVLVAVLAIVRPDSNPAFDQLPGLASYDLAILPFEEGDSAALGRALARYTSLRLEWNPRWDLMPVRQSFERWDAERLGDADAISNLRSMYTARGTIVVRDSYPALVLSIDSAGRPLDQVTVPGGTDPL